jgi:protein tyrosine/serine phosphatase
VTRRLLSLVLLATSAVACASVSGAPAAPAAASGCLLPDGSAVPIENFHQVDERLYRGAQPDAAGFRALKALGVKTVVNLRGGDWDAAPAREAGLDVVEMPLHAKVLSTPPSDDEVRRFLEIVRDPARTPVFVHCRVGKDRTGTMCALYRIEELGWDCDRAVAEMQGHGFHDWYRDLKSYVLGYRRGSCAPRAPADAAACASVTSAR